MLRSVWRSLPAVTRLGSILGTLGLAGDVIHHALAPNLLAGRALDLGSVGHVLTLAGMVLALSGVVGAARAARRRAREKGGSDAVARVGAAAPR